MGARLAAAAKSMNSWTCFLHGDGGAALGEFEQDIKDFPDVAREVIDVLIERPVVDGEEAQLPVLQGHELGEVRRADLVQVSTNLAHHPHRAQERLHFNERETRFGRQDHEEEVWLAGALDVRGGGQGLDLPGGGTGVGGVDEGRVQEVFRRPFDERFRVVDDRRWGGLSTCAKIVSNTGPACVARSSMSCPNSPSKSARKSSVFSLSTVKRE